jgi:hypothetical protein
MTPITPIACRTSFIEDASVQIRDQMPLLGLCKLLRMSAFWSNLSHGDH